MLRVKPLAIQVHVQQNDGITDKVHDLFAEFVEIGGHYVFHLDVLRLLSPNAVFQAPFRIITSDAVHPLEIQFYFIRGSTIRGIRHGVESEGDQRMQGCVQPCAEVLRFLVVNQFSRRPRDKIHLVASSINWLLNYMHQILQRILLILLVHFKFDVP
jgi:hypothetical protein